MAKSFIIGSVFRKTKSFYVKTKSEPNYEREGGPNYDTALDMWQNEIDWGKLANIVSNQCKGSLTLANEISLHLTIFKKIASNATMNPFEYRMYESYLRDPRFKIFLSRLEKIDSWKVTRGNKAQGDILEDFLDNSVAAALEATSNPIRHGKTGGRLVGSLSSMGVVTVTLPFGGSPYTTRTLPNGEIERILKDSIKQEVKELLNIESSLKQLLEMNVFWRRGNTYFIEVKYGTPRLQKIDDDFGSVNLYIKDSGMLDRFLGLIAGATFSAKNYSFGNSLTDDFTRRIGFGHTSKYRKYSSFYYAAAKRDGRNGLDAATFCWATDQSTHLLPSYRLWVDLLYEMLGIGQQADNRLVDYIIINNADSVTDRIAVISMKDILGNINANSFSQSPNLVLSKYGTTSFTRGANASSFSFS